MCKDIEELNFNTHKTCKEISRRNMTQCLGKTSVGLRCVLTRLVFMLHLLLLIWRCWNLYGENLWMWWLATALVAMLGELAVVLHKRDGQEWRRFCPSYFFYLLGALPAVWCIELDRLDSLRKDEAASFNQTSTADFGGFSLEVTLRTTEWALALEQSMIFLLLIGRWILPKGGISREKISQLLLVYLCTGIDILELFELFKEPKILQDQTFVYIVLTAFCWSLLQFTFLLTPPRRRRRPTRRQVVDVEIANNWDNQEDKLKTDSCRFIFDEKFAIIVSLFMQDLPFLAIRIVSIAHYRVFTYANTFFAVKNAIMVLLQLYRLLVLACVACENIEDNDKDSCDDITLADNKTNEGKAPYSGANGTNTSKDKPNTVSIAIQVGEDVTLTDLSSGDDKQGVQLSNDGTGEGEVKNADSLTKPARPSTGKRVTILRPTTAVARPVSGGRPTSARPGSARPGKSRPISARPATPGNVLETAVSDDSGIGGENSDQKETQNEASDENNNNDAINNSDLDIGRPQSRGPIFFSHEKPPSAMRRSVTPSRKSVTFFDDGTDTPEPTMERRSATPRPGTPGPGGRTPTPSRSRPGTPGPRSVSAMSGRRSVTFKIDDDEDEPEEGTGLPDDDEFSRGSPSSFATFRTELRSVTPSRKSVTFREGTIDNEGRASRISRPSTPVHTKQKQLQKVLGRRGVAKHKPVSTPKKN